jgi:hypothetical protein
MPLPPAEAAVASVWTPQFQTQLTKYLQDLFINQPPSFLPVLKAEEIQVDKRLILRDLVTLTKEPNFRLIGATGNPAFANSWINFDVADTSAAFWRDPFGWIHLRGLIKNGTVGSAAFTLPPGFRPPKREVFATISNGAVGRVDVQADGLVIPQSPSNNAWVSLAGIHFRTS